MSAEDTSTRDKMLQHLEELMHDVDLYSWEHYIMVSGSI